eukprot:scaffold591234_cov27-Prasinocladus_malaysianus.AAC.1
MDDEANNIKTRDCGYRFFRKCGSIIDCQSTSTNISRKASVRRTPALVRCDRCLGRATPGHGRSAGEAEGL